ncbi:ricin-type beta-trefoil lectin domain protein [Streptomyces sp. NPDC048362]|uniref:ricin-type beta-trefoil lectin domain protein n=1 Tax=Streptomyces sp. NPDC048362 TaxID=3365539 RepID=UPI003723ECDD
MNEAGPPSDEELSAELRKWTGTSPALHPVGELLDRHWEAAFAYAQLCTDGPRAAGMLTTTAFTRLFGEALRHDGPTAAWRPQVLVAVRRIAAEWDVDDRRELLHPALRSDDGTGRPAAARLLPSPDRQLLSRAFQRTPAASRAVLWHSEVEAEPPTVAAVLLGLDEEDVRVELHRARERLREECLQAHRELAPETECHRYLRMLDVTFRRGGVDIDPDLRAHLGRCPHCDRTAGQLTCFTRGLGGALAEAVLGWGADAYTRSRTNRAETPAEPAPDPAAVVFPAGEAFAPTPARAYGRPDAPTGPAGSAARPPAARRSARRAASAVSGRSARRAARRTRRRHLALAVVTVTGLVALPLVLWSALGPGETPAAGSGTNPTPAPGTNSPSPGATWAGANTPGRGAPHGRLHNFAANLCVGVVGEKAVAGAETELTACSATPSQRWTYKTDGTLRDDAAPDLCLDSHLGYSVRLAPCAATGGAARNLRYDFTRQGALVPRWNRGLALTPAATDGSGALVLKLRAAGAAQRWSFDTSQPDLQMRNVDWGRESALPPAPR